MKKRTKQDEEFIRVYNNEVTPERKFKLLECLSGISNDVDKINFLHEKKTEYLQNISPEVLTVSGVTDYPNIEKGAPLFFDRFIQLEIDKILEKGSVGTLVNPLRDYRDLIWQIEAFQSNVIYYLNDQKGLQKYCREITDGGIYDIAHRAKIEIENLLLTDHQRAEFITNALKVDAEKINQQDLKIRKSNNMGNVNVYLSVRPFFVVMQSFYDFYNFLLERKIIVPIEKNNETQLPTRNDELRTEVEKYGFYDLQKVKSLSAENRQKLLQGISDNGLPYAIAMFEHLGFIDHLSRSHFPIKGSLFKAIAKWFHADKSGRSVKGNISSLKEYTNEDKARYTAYKHKEKVQKDLQKLK